MERQNAKQDVFYRVRTLLQLFNTHMHACCCALLGDQCLTINLQNAFFTVSLLFGLLKLYCTLSQLFLPWQLPFHFYLDKLFSFWLVALLEFISAVPYVLCGFYMRPQQLPQTGSSSGNTPSEVQAAEDIARQKQILFYTALGLHVPLVMILSITYLFTLPTSPVGMVHLVWFFGAGLAYIALCRYLNMSMIEVEAGVRDLYKYTYPCKKA